MPMPRRQFRPVRRRRRKPGPLAWAGFAGGVTMGAVAAALITGSNDQPLPQTTQLASGELPQALKNLVAEYLAEEGYRPAEDVRDEPVPPPGSAEPDPAEVPAPAPAQPPVPAAPVPVVPVSTRGGSSLWPIEFVPEPLALPASPSPLTVSAQPLDLGAVADTAPAAADAVPSALRAITEPDSEPVPDTLRVADVEPAPAHTGPAPVTPLVDAQPGPDTSLVDARPFAATETAAPAPEPETTGPSIAEVGAGDVVVAADSVTP